MAFSKSHLYPKEDQALSYFAFAISHPARISILRQLSTDGPCRVERITENHPISQPAMSLHLRILRKAHWVNYQEKFPYTYYALDSKNVSLAKKYLSSFFQAL